jgi:uncharacterized Ntn-hydrolase superfamily protein
VDLRTGRLVIASATCVSQAALRAIPAAGLMDIQAIVVPGMGIAAAQASVDRTRAGQRLIDEQLRAGTDPSAILEMLRADPASERRQFAIVDMRGRAAAWSGNENGAVSLSRQGQARGSDIHYSVQGNILASDEVVLAAVAALDGVDGDLLDRVMAAMEAADAAGGDRRCTCATEPIPAAACTAKTAHVAYLLAADPDDAVGDWFLYLDVNDENIAPDENANPVVTLRARFDAWRRQSVAGLPQS